MTSEAVDKLIENMVKEFSTISSVWLIGSRANGAQMPNDWDLVVFADQPTFDAIKRDKSYREDDVDLLVVVDGNYFEDPTWIPESGRRKPKSGRLRGSYGWDWELLGKGYAKYIGNDKNGKSMLCKAKRIWPKK